MPELVCYRASAYRTPTRVRAHHDLGRYNGIDSPPTQYFSLHPLGPWAEVIRNRGYTDPEDALTFRLPIWAIRLVLPNEPFHIDFDAADAGATPAPIAARDLIADDQLGCRAFGDAIRATPAVPKVFRVPSAALPGTENIVIFGARAMIEYLAAPRRAQQVPASLVAVAARAPRSLLPLIRHRGRPHAGYEAWAQGDRYVLPAV